MTATVEAPPRTEAAREKPSALLITGIASHLARRLAERLVGDPLFPRVIGIDYIAPVQPVPGVETLRFDLLDPGLRELLRSEKVTAIAHLLWLPEPLDIDAALRVNVGGTLRLVAAAAEAGVRALAFRSSTSIYGASPANPLFIAEDAFGDGAPGDRRAQHLLEVEAHLAGAGGRRPGLAMAVLRLAPILGAGAESRLAAYLRPPTVPTALGFDPRIQLIHEDDAVEAIAHALRTRFAGAVNVAAPGVLPLHRVLRLLGRTAVPLPRALLGAALMLHARLAGRPHLRMDGDALRSPPVGELRRMERDLGFRPRLDALSAVQAVAAQARAHGGDGWALSNGELAARREADAERDRLREALRRGVTGERHGK